MSEQKPEESGAGILQSLRILAATFVVLLQTRFELLAADLEEERIRLLQLMFWAAGAVFFFSLAALLLTLLLVVLFWDTHRIAVIVGLAAVFLVAGVVLAVGVRNRLHSRPRMFSGSLDALARDKDRLTSR